MPDPFIVFCGIVLACSVPAAIRDLRRLFRALRLTVAITGAVTKDRD